MYNAMHVVHNAMTLYNVIIICMILYMTLYNVMYVTIDNAYYALKHAAVHVLAIAKCPLCTHTMSYACTDRYDTANAFRASFSEMKYLINRHM